MDMKIASIQYFDFAIAQIPFENADEVILIALKNMYSLIYYYIPTRFVLEKKKVVFDALLNLFASPNIKNNTKNIILDNIFEFLSDNSHLALA